MFDYLCYFQTSTFLSKRSLFLKVPFPTGQAFFQDIDWFLRVNRRPDTRLVIVAEPLTVYNEPRRRVTVTSAEIPWKAAGVGARPIAIKWAEKPTHALSWDPARRVR